MTKRPSPDEQPDGHRDIKRIRIEYADAEVKKNEAEAHYYALMNELRKHPVCIAEMADKDMERGRKHVKEFLPPYLYHLLAVKGVSNFALLTDASISPDWPDSSHMHDICFDVRLSFGDKETCSYSIYVDTERPEDEIEYDGIRVPHADVTIKDSLTASNSRTAIAILWDNAMQFNNKHVPKAIASLVLWAMNKSRLAAVDDGIEFESFYSIADVGKELSKLKGAKHVEKGKVIDVSDGSSDPSDDASSSSSESV